MGKKHKKIPFPFPRELFSRIYKKKGTKIRHNETKQTNESFKPTCIFLKMDGMDSFLFSPPLILSQARRSKSINALAHVGHQPLQPLKKQKYYR